MCVQCRMHPIPMPASLIPRICVHDILHLRAGSHERTTTPLNFLSTDSSFLNPSCSLLHQPACLSHTTIHLHRSHPPTTTTITTFSASTRTSHTHITSRSRSSNPKSKPFPQNSDTQRVRLGLGLLAVSSHLSKL